jgi:hypothetical protein
MSDIYDLRELTAELDALRTKASAGLDDEEQDRLEQLEALDAEFFAVFADSMEDYADNIDPILIADSYFEDYARQLAEDIGAIDRNQGWPACHIDWKAASENLLMDYTSVSFEGREYWIRG